MIFKNPFTQPSFVFVQWQIPMFGFTHHWFTATDSTFRIDQVGRRKWCSALLALVTVGSFCMAGRTFTGNITVGQELMGFFVVILHGGLFNELTFIIQGFEEFGSQFVVCLWCSTRVYIEWNSKFFEWFFYQGMIAVHHILWSNTFFLCTNGDRYSVFVRASDEKNIFFFQAEIAHVDISRNIYTCQMTNMYRTVCVGQSGCDGGSFEFIFHCMMSFLLFLPVTCKVSDF